MSSTPGSAYDATGTPPSAGTRRLHVALAVRHLDRAIAFYTALFGRGPSKRRRGWARFEPEHPALHLALREVDVPTAPGHPAAHFGVQVHDPQSVRDEAARLARAGLATEVEHGVVCCYAMQDKVWVTDPDGNRWETYVVLDDDAPCCGEGPDDATCCAEGRDGATCCAEGREGRDATRDEAGACCPGPGR